MTEKRLDIILFGASGLVGRYGVRELHRLTSTENLSLSWGVAGKNSARLQEELHRVYQITNDAKILQVPVFEADMTDSDSVEHMVKSTKVLLNFCGPLRKFGETVIKSCIEFKTHYLDLSAEPNFIEKIQLEYDEQARKAGIYIANSCGFDSLSYEMGVVFLQRNFKGSLNSVETYLKYGAEKSGIPGPTFNNSTWNSMIDLLGNTTELRDIRKRRNNVLPDLRPTLKHRVLPFRPKYEEGWAVPSPSADLSVMRRTQQFLFREKRIEPIQIESYFMFDDLLYVLFFLIGGLFLIIFSKFQLGRKLLIRNPSLFSGGIFSSEEPTEEKLDNIWCNLTMIGKGKRDGLNPGINGNEVEIVARIRGDNTAYKLTSLCLVLAGVMLLTQCQNLPERKGVLTPGVLFSRTSIIDELDRNGLKFELVSKECKKNSWNSK